MQNAGIILPARFLCIMAHIIITITIFWSKNANVVACLPLRYTTTEYDTKDTELTVGLSISLGLLVIELISFFAGVSMFKAGISMLSVICHASAAITLSLFVLNSMDCDAFWYVFGFCCALPTVIEFFAIIGYCRSMTR
ncbi:transmembrane protein 107-like [Rhopilema esculentum]|uniref:transmembrane protein 107-like n=1 Tax=Rhopilema esculentum TaxID=499914 RepID=UPI0031DC546F